MNQNEYDNAISLIGQAEAERYLRKTEAHRLMRREMTNQLVNEVIAGIAFLVSIGGILLFLLAF